MKNSQNFPEEAKKEAIEQAILRIEFGQIESEAEFMKKWGNLSNSELGKAAHEMELLGFKLRHLLWNRLEAHDLRN